MIGQALSFSEPVIRLGAFVGVFVVMGVWELAAPKRPQAISRARRWPGNLGFSIINTLALRILFPAAAVGAAIFAESRGWGLFQVMNAPAAVAILGSVIALDLVIYLQHRLFHAVPLLWRLHRVHHTDLEFDVTTGVRFHPAEILLSMLIKIAAVVALGAPAVAVLVFEVLLNATTMFNHANIKLPRALDRIVRLIVVTPDMHRVHHSVRREETNSNFGFSLPWWDRAFRTYRAQPADGHDRMTIGVENFRDPASLHLSRMLLQPVHADDR
ncbi:sterol desaturase family protein [Terricaulis sp.]|uniref:sterol desaturase family protein n=1 Tax=Terricaulis sp. TaxID=2768686 RepID=UPI002AC5FC79|nr:sterol desaturase family protein [Terricaulis sp.]MDZ4692958.1 sterol desaturase family protein [Terricaulis sp.]